MTFLKICFMLLVANISLWLEVSLANAGIYFPTTLIAVFYTTILFGWRYTICFTPAISSIIDSLHGTNSILPALICLIGATVWRKKGDCSQYFIQWVPILFFLMPAVLIHLYISDISVKKAVVLALQAIILVPFFPFAIFVADKIVVGLGLTSYNNIQSEEFYAAR